MAVSRRKRFDVEHFDFASENDSSEGTPSARICQASSASTPMSAVSMISVL